MKLICWNVWGGKCFNEMMKFINDHKGSTDIFCFQEVLNTSENIRDHFSYRANLYNELQNELKEFKGFHYVSQSNYALGDLESFYNKTEKDISFGLSIFVRNNVKILSQYEEFVVSARDEYKGTPETFPRQFVGIELDTEIGKLLVVNYHGMWVPGNKFDTPERLEASRIVKRYMDSFKGKKILCGDFNIVPNTESIDILSDGKNNLIQTYNIENTRSNHYPKEKRPCVCDYTIVSNDVLVKDFQIPYSDGSDHLPMVIEFS